ncbi:MAG: glycosyltransferase [Dehalococcoidia bacterium]|nr:glycosyltransferase [Dehalococcoidia bacterium]
MSADEYEKQPVLLPPDDGTVYSKRKGFCPFSVPSLDAYTAIVGERRMERLEKAAQKLKGLKFLELNATARGGGVAEMLYSSVPFLNAVGIEDEWKVIKGEESYFEVTKALHNLLQGKKGKFTPEMKQIYFSTLEKNARENIIDYSPDVVLVHDPQPLGLTRFLKKKGETWFWRCHIDIEGEVMNNGSRLWSFVTSWAQHYDAAIFSASHYAPSCWPLPEFIIPPFIDPLSEKNRELTREEIDRVLEKYHIDFRVPIIAQIGRFDPWKGFDRTLATFRRVREEKKCQLVLAGGLASDDPEGVSVLSDIYQQTERDEDIHVLNLPMADRLENCLEVNALQRAASVIMQPSTKEGFGLVITEALWKGKPVIASEIGGIPLQIKDESTGYYYKTSMRAAEKIIYLLSHQKAATSLGARGREYVGEHFLLPDRIADYLIATDTIINVAGDRKLHPDSIISYHPWFKLGKRR